MSLGWNWPFIWQGQIWQNANTLDIMESFECFGQKMVIRVVLMRTLRFMSRRGQSHCLTFDPGLSLYDKFKHLLKSHWANCNQYHLEPPGADGTKICSNRIVHMTNMATTSIYGKILLKSLTPEPVDWWSCNLVWSIGCFSTTKIVQMMTLCWPWPIIRHSQLWENANT